MDNTYPPRFRDGGAFFMPGGHHGGGSALGWAIFALQLLMLAALALLIVRAFSFRRVRLRRHGPLAVEEILRHRYARGEISRDEYLQASQDLGATGHTAPPAEDAPTAEL